MPSSARGSPKSDEILRREQARALRRIKFTLRYVRFFAFAQNDKFVQTVGACIAFSPAICESNIHCIDLKNGQQRGLSLRLINKFTYCHGIFFAVAQKDKSAHFLFQKQFSQNGFCFGGAEFAGGIFEVFQSFPPLAVFGDMCFSHGNIGQIR